MKVNFSDNKRFTVLGKVQTSHAGFLMEAVTQDTSKYSVSKTQQTK